MASLFHDAERQTNGFSTFRATIVDEVTGVPQYNDDQMQRSVDQEAVTFMLELPWFRRLWTLREAALAPKNTAVLGTSRFDLLDMLRALMWWAHGQQSTSSIKALAGMTCIQQSQLYIDHDQSFMAGSFTLADLLFCSMIFEKTEPRDGVFAIISLLSNIPPQLRIPDYNKPLSEILRTATRLAILERGDLEILRLVKTRPSDLEGAHVTSWVLRVDRQNNAAVDSIALYSEFAAAEGLGKDTSLTLQSLDSATLLTRGYIVGEVETLSRVYTRADFRYTDTFLLWIREAFDLYGVRVASQTLPQARRAFALTILGSGILGHTFQLATDKELKPLDDITDLLWYGAEVHITNDIDHPLHAPLLDVGHTFRTDFTINRRFFVTNSGRPGLGPRAMQTGNIVTLLRGVRTPIILRPLSDGRYQLVGETYVDGIMFGEAWKECKTTGAVEEEFLLV
ncbi:hypothetical protein LTS10_008444 [Elasticomyces elasticus]|nr:hypothetical protein LTS10_008444 [Elasticomyces elasticus]